MFQQTPALLQLTLYGSWRWFIVAGSITEVEQRRARSIIGWVTAWNYQVLYALGHACSDIVSWGSENRVNQMARLTDIDLDAKNLNGRRRSFHQARPLKIHNVVR